MRCSCDVVYITRDLAVIFGVVVVVVVVLFRLCLILSLLFIAFLLLIM